MNNLLVQTLLSLAICCSLGASLDCIQCDMGGRWYSEEEHERQVELCQMGRIEPTLCTNRTHTHCIVSWWRSGGNSERTVTERRCGTIDDVTGCTLYNSKISRKVRRRHLLNNKEESRREPVPTYVEVCSESCPFGDCVNSSPPPASLLTVLLLPLFLFH